MKKYLLLPLIGLALVGLITFGTNRVLADENQESYPPIIQKLVERFGLNEAEVKAVFDKEQEEQQKQRQNRYQEKLSQLVQNGNLSEEQKQLILKKHEELQAEWQTNASRLHGLTPEEKRTAMEQKRTELENWAKENGIDSNLLTGFGDFGGKPHGSRGKGFGFTH